MRSKKTTLATATAISALFLASPAMAQTEIQWWHAMGGSLGELLESITQDFNESQDDYVVNPVYKGEYNETMTGAIAAFRAGEQPHIVQIYEVGTATMMAAEGAIRPVYEVMEKSEVEFDPDAYLPAVTGYYTTTEGDMLSLPFNSSTPVMFYNKDAFEEAGLDPEQPPRTWPEVEEYSQALLDAGYECGFTTGWPSWVQLENFSALHNVPFASKENGFAGTDIEALFNSDLHKHHIGKLAEWQESGVFSYGGRYSDSQPKFIGGECPIYMDSSASRAGLVSNIEDFEFGVGMLPYWPDVEDAPQNSIIGGASLWVLEGHSEEEYEGVAAFFEHLSSPEVQAEWHQKSGYLPITEAAFELTEEQGYYDENPGADISVEQMNLNPPTEYSKGLRIGNFVQIRDIINEELQATFADDKTAAEALDEAVERSNSQMDKFHRQNN
ncbi:sn-glycerol-3-phosphate ABC transporter substrate-binding protein UgpB [Fodinicurvata halophila]|uniref:sn-glycerol-3-phosphate-binding periplasmic protein UgpB n=1 Tax=Fodinicurvata halophila TaxID=1419723 RepID=A0ABV8UNN6_9PROT